MTIEEKADAVVKEHGPYIEQIRDALETLGCSFISFVELVGFEKKHYEIQFTYKDKCSKHRVGPYEFVAVYPNIKDK